MPQRIILLTRVGNQAPIAVAMRALHTEEIKEIDHVLRETRQRDIERRRIGVAEAQCIRCKYFKMLREKRRQSPIIP